MKILQDYFHTEILHAVIDLKKKKKQGFFAFIFESFRMGQFLEQKSKKSPGKCGWIGLASFHALKNHQFKSWSGHMPRVWVQS